MLLSLFEIFTSGGFTRETAILYIVFSLITYAVLIFVSLPIHELAHALVAYWLGDRTAKWHGRLTLNPLKHLDLMGTLMMLLCGFGYAKPVPINPRNFRNPRVGMALTALAGPVSNFLVVILSVAVFRVMYLVAEIAYPIAMDQAWFELYLTALGVAKFFLIDVIVGINLTLAIFNMIPIPPLDGSRIASLILPEKWFFTLARYERYFTIGLIVLLLTPGVSSVISLLSDVICRVLFFVFGMPNIY